MKNVFSDKKTYLIGIPLGIVGTGLPFGIWGLVYGLSGNNTFPYYIILAAIAFCYYMAGLLVADLSELKYRKQNHIVLQESVPVEIHQKYQNKKAPYFLGAFMVVTALIVVAMIFVFTHSWPLIG